MILGTLSQFQTLTKFTHKVCHSEERGISLETLQRLTIIE